ncbi:MAG: peptidoglycan-binding protein [Leptolyngbyaceae cyanobacterium bins.59]|nr:peptidoglycan-binding protein [Leptolyngbyaceae cyanobacterium bins.59]
MEVIAYQYVALLYEKSLAAEKMNRVRGVQRSGLQSQPQKQKTMASRSPSSQGRRYSPKPHKNSPSRHSWFSVLILALLMSLGMTSGTIAALSRGSRGPAVTSLQLSLRNAGYNPGTIDGVFGRSTENAVRQFQRDRNLQADGVVGARTEAALTRSGRPSSGSGPTVISASRTRELQRLLARRGCYRGPIDGVYGPGTNAAVQRAQRAYGLVVDGVPGPATLAALRRSSCNCS